MELCKGDLRTPEDIQEFFETLPSVGGYDFISYPLCSFVSNPTFHAKIPPNKHILGLSLVSRDSISPGFQS